MESDSTVSEQFILFRPMCVLFNSILINSVLNARVINPFKLRERERERESERIV
jgi:hypothetical protein